MNDLTHAQIRKFEDLLNAMSPENVACDGEASQAQQAATWRRLKNEWAMLERQVGRTVPQDEIEQIQIRRFRGSFPEMQSSRFIRQKPVHPDDLRRAALEVLGMAGEFLAADKWEAPSGDRKNWRKKKPDGTFEYRADPPDGKATQNQDGSKVKQDGKTEQKPVKTEDGKKPVKYKMHLHLDKAKLQETLTKGHFSIISAGRNPSDPKEAMLKPDDGFFHKRHEQLRDELEKAGLQYTEVVGHYGGEESSFLVFHDGTELTPKTQKAMMVHHRNEAEAKEHRKIVEQLGKKFNQDSILYGSAGRNEIVFTSGSKAGKTCGGNGWKEMPEAKDFYTDIKLDKQNHTKVSLDIHECFERGML